MEPEQAQPEQPPVDGLIPPPPPAQPVPADAPVSQTTPRKKAKRKTTKAIAQTASQASASEAPDNLPTDQALVPIGQAAAILGISVDTVRRWDKAGILHSERPDGKNRYFSVDELERLKFAQPLTISEASEQLNISPSTLRRLEEKGMIAPQRNEQGERMYDRETLEKFLHSDYFLRQREVEEEILKPLSGPEAQESTSTETKHDPVAHAVIGEHQVELSRLKRFRTKLKQGAAVLGTAMAILVAVITVLFLIFPESTAKSLGYYRKNPNSKKYTFTPSDSIIARQLKPFSQLSLTAIEAVSPSLRERVAPKDRIKDVNDVLAPDSEGNITSLYTFTVPDTSYLRIPDQGLVVNLNAEFLQGRIPGERPGDLAILPVGTDEVENGAITLEKLSPEARNFFSSLNISGNLTGSSGASGGDITEVLAGNGLQGGGTSGGVTLSVKVDSGSGIEAGTNGISLLRGCASGQVLKWNGSAWTCQADQAGASFDVAGDSGTPQAVGAGDTLNVFGGTAISTVASATDQITVNLNTGNGLQVAADALTLALHPVGSGLQVDASGLSITRSCGNGEVLKWSGAGWNCGVDTSGGSLALKEGGTIVVNPASVLNFAAGDFTVTDAGLGQGDIVIDYANSGITRKSQNETIAGAWTMQQTLTFSGSATDIDTAAAEGLVLQGRAASSLQTTAGNINIAPAGASTGRVTIGSGSASATPDLLVLDVKNTSGDPAGTDGAVYYNSVLGKFRCFQNGAWTDCVGAGGGGSTAWNGLTPPSGNLSLNHGEFTTAFNWDNVTGNSLDAFTLGVSNSLGGEVGTQRLVVLRNNNVVGGGTTEVLLRVDNADADSLLGKGIEVTSSGGNGVSTAFDASDSLVVNALSIGPNRILGTTGTIDFDNFDVASSGTVTIGAFQSYTGIDAVTVSSGGGGNLTLDSSSNTLQLAVSDTAINAPGLATFTTSNSLSLNPTSGTTYTLGTSAATLNLFNANASTISMAQAATTLDIASTGSLARTINLGSGTGADAINIGTGATGADAITLGNTGAATTLTFNTGVTTGTAFTEVANSVTSGTAFSLQATGLTTGNAMAITGGSALTTGSLLQLAGASYNPAAGQTGSLANISFTGAATNASGNSIVNGINVASTINTVGGAGTKEINAANIAAPTVTACVTGACTWSGLKVNTLTAGALSNLTSNGISVNAAGISAGTLNGMAISGITAGAGSEYGLSIGRGWDNAINIDPSVTGTIINAQYATAATQTGALTGMALDFSTNFTPAQSRAITGVEVSFPGLAVTGSVTNYTGFNIGSATTLTTNPGFINWNGASFTMPNITQLGGTITANGLRVTTGTISSGGTMNGLNVVAQGADAGTLNGLNIGAITAGAGSETGIRIGSGWDTALDLSAAMGTSALSVGANNITGTTAVINFDNFDVSSGGLITVATGQGLDCNAGSCSLQLGGTNATTLGLGAGGSLARTINIGTGTGVDTINLGTGGTGADLISIGSSANSWNITSGGNLTLGKASTATGNLVFANSGGAGTTTIQAGNQGATNMNWILPTVAPSTGTTFLSCIFVAPTCTLTWGTSATALNDLQPAGASNTISNGDHAQVWNWSLTTASKTAFTFGENVASTASGSYIMKVSTLAASTAAPLSVSARGNTIIDTTATGGVSIGNTATAQDTTLSVAATNLVNVLTGNLKVGNAAPSVSLNGEDAFIEGTLEVDGAARFDGGISATLAGNAGAANIAAVCTTDGVGNQTITRSTAATPSTCSTVSSIETKTNVNTLTMGLETLKQLRAVSFNYRSELDYTDRLQIGFIAEEVHQIFPDAVDYDENGNPAGLSYQQFTGLIVQSIQDLSEAVDLNYAELTQGLQMLNQRVNGLEGRVASLEASQGSQTSVSTTPDDIDASSVRANQIVGTDIGHGYDSDEALSLGDVVSIDQANPNKVKKSAQPNDPRLAGVVSSSAALMVGGEEKDVIVALSGTVSVKVSGPVAEGDLLTSSTTPGVAMRATGSVPIIGRALGSFSGEGTGTVLVLVKNGEGGIVSELAGIETRLAEVETQVESLKTASQIDLENLQAGSMTVTLDLRVGGGLVIGGDATFKGLTFFEKTATFIGKVVFRQEVEFEGRVTFNKDTAGFAQIKTGEQTIRITFDQPYTQIPVVSATLGNGKFAAYAISNLSTEGFDIVLQTPALEDLQFNWVALSVKDASTVSSQP